LGKLDRKVAIVTGAAAGIGEAIARLFAAEGARIIIADINHAEAEEVAQEIRHDGGEASAIRTNVAAAADVRNMINHTLDIFGRVDILVNNAGIGSTPVPLHATDEDDWDRVLAVSLRGAFLGMKYVLPQMMEQGGGNIINMASIAGIVGAANLGPYAAAKAGIIELTRVAAAEYSKFNIRCNALAPGWTRTRMVDEFINGNEKVEAGMLRSLPMRRFGDVREIAHAALFLASDDTQFLQGQTIVLDGGLTNI
jgi:NAD(P)-dependent dehydrogenase (short-subunit alcohol dehydrogenase family)